MIRNIIIIVLIGIGVIALSGCASNNASAPCANYGKWCHKTPINSWNHDN